MDEQKHFLIDYCSITTKNGQYNFVLYFYDKKFYLDQCLQRPPAVANVKTLEYDSSIGYIREMFNKKIQEFKQSDQFISFNPRYKWVQLFPWIEHTRSNEIIVTYHFEDYELDCGRHKITFLFDDWGYCYGCDIDQHFFIDYEVFEQWFDAGQYYFENVIHPDIYRETWLDKVYQWFAKIQYNSNVNDLIKHTRAYGRTITPTYKIHMTDQYNVLIELLMQIVNDPVVNAHVSQTYLNHHWNKPVKSS